MITFENVSHAYGRQQSVTDISFQIEGGRVVTFLDRLVVAKQHCFALLQVLKPQLVAKLRKMEIFSPAQQF